MNFIGRHLPLTKEDLVQEAARLQVRVALLHAFSEVESKGAGFLPTGEPVILFESRQFHVATNGRYDQIAPDLSTPTWVRNYGAAGLNQYTRLKRAMALDQDAALGACSWGRYQQMGYQFWSFNFASVTDFVTFMCDSEANHLHIFAEFCRVNGMLASMRSTPPDYADLARRYNGPGYRTNAYDRKLADADREYSQAGEDYIPPLPPNTALLKVGSRGNDVRALQRALGISADGIFGRETLVSVIEWQRRNGFTQDGIISARQRAKLNV